MQHPKDRSFHWSFEGLRALISFIGREPKPTVEDLLKAAGIDQKDVPVICEAAREKYQKEMTRAYEMEQQANVAHVRAMTRARLADEAWEKAVEEAERIRKAAEREIAKVDPLFEISDLMKHETIN